MWFLLQEIICHRSQKVQRPRLLLVTGSYRTLYHPPFTGLIRPWTVIMWLCKKNYDFTQTPNTQVASPLPQDSGQRGSGDIQPLAFPHLRVMSHSVISRADFPLTSCGLFGDALKCCVPQDKSAQGLSLRTPEQSFTWDWETSGTGIPQE